MKKWKVVFKPGVMEGKKNFIIVLADRRYEAQIKAGVQVGLGGFQPGYILDRIKSCTQVDVKAGRPRSLAAWNEKDWQKEAGLE